MNVEEAFSQLNNSERGRQAVLDLKNLLDSGGYGLDAFNLAALSSIFASMKSPEGYQAVRSKMSQIRKPGGSQ